MSWRIYNWAEKFLSKEQNRTQKTVSKSAKTFFSMCYIEWEKRQIGKWKWLLKKGEKRSKKLKVVGISALMEKIKMKIILFICLGLNWHGVAAEDGASGAAEETIQQLFLREPNDQVSANNQWIAKFKVP